jgi:hypothetical protein
MKNNKQQTAMKLYTEEHLKLFYQLGKFDGIARRETDVEEEIKNHLPIELPSDEEIEEKLNVAYGNGYEQGEMDFYKTMQGKGNQYADGYAEGYQRALELVKFQIVEQLEARR